MYFTHAGGKTYANMQQKAGGSTLPPGATGARWYMYWKVGANEFWVRAAINNLGTPAIQYWRDVMTW